MKLRVSLPEMNGAEAMQLAQKEGIGHVVKDGDRFGHIWLEGYNGPMAISYFEPDRDVAYLWHRWEVEAKGWVGLASRGWRVKGESYDESLAYVSLLFVGEDVIRAEAEKEARKLNLQAGVWHVWPYGVPKRKESTSSKAEPGLSTIAMLEILKTVEERWRSLHRRQSWGGEWEDPEEFESWGVKGWVDHDHFTAILPKSGLATFKDAMAKQGITYDEGLTLSSLERTTYGDEEVYAKPGSGFCYRCAYVDKGLRAWYPRFLRDKYAPGIRVHYPSKAAPLVAFTDDQDWFIVAAPYVA